MQNVNFPLSIAFGNAAQEKIDEIELDETLVRAAELTVLQLIHSERFLRKSESTWQT